MVVRDSDFPTNSVLWGLLCFALVLLTELVCGVIRLQDHLDAISRTPMSPLHCILIVGRADRRWDSAGVYGF